MFAFVLCQRARYLLHEQRSSLAKARANKSDAASLVASGQGTGPASKESSIFKNWAECGVDGIQTGGRAKGERLGVGSYTSEYRNRSAKSELRDARLWRGKIGVAIVRTNTPTM